MKSVTVLSLFDGMSCGRIALERAGFCVNKYYASEIDKYAQIVSAANYPDIIKLGDVTKWQNWNIETPDIILAGSPCQGFSFAGKRLNFDDERSRLFFTFVDILKHYKPKYFLLENVIMDKKCEYVISEMLGNIYPEHATKSLFSHILEPMEINSALLSAQNRRRLYWFNWSVKQPTNKGILLKDIVEDGEVDVSKKQRTKLKCIEVGKADIRGNDQMRRVYSTDGKSPCLSTCQGGHREPKIQVTQEKSQTILSTIYKENLKSMKKRGKDGLHVGWRKLTPLECERLQTVPDNYTAHVSNSQRYKMLGNGWTVDVISHILNAIL